jgi:hypothetical protein
VRAHRGELLRRLDATLRADVQQSRAESVSLIEKWNGGAFAYPDHACLHGLFSRSARANPDAAAIIYQDKTVSGVGRTGRCRVYDYGVCFWCRWRWFVFLAAPCAPACLDWRGMLAW